jgi:tetratricopeptide (TPR) repeat protein
MPGKVIPLILSTLMVLSSTEVVFEQKEPYDLSNQISTLSALWAGDLEGDRTPEILVGGIIYEAGISKGALVMIKRNEVSLLASVPSISRTLVMTVCDAVQEEGREIVAGSRGLYVFSRSGKLIREKSTAGDVTALQYANFDGTGLDEIIYGTSAGNVVHLVDLEQKHQFAVGSGVKFILQRDENTYYVVTSHSIQCWDAEGKQVWSHTVKGEIRGAISHDINNDVEKEVIFISGANIYSLSFDSQKETLLISPRDLPLSLIVEEFTGDGKLDLILTSNKDRLQIYSNFREEVQSFYLKRQSDEIPLLYAIDFTHDGKMDLINGGMTNVWVFENVTPPQELITRGEVLFSQGEDLFKQGKYEEALAKFEEAKPIFVQVRNDERTAQCQEYINRIAEILEKASRALSILDEGKQLYAEGKYRDAKAKLKTAVEEYTTLSKEDEQYEPFLAEAQDLINQCDLAVADEYFQNGETLLQEKRYDEAIDLFQAAEIIYSQLGNDKAQVSREKILEIRSLQEKKIEIVETNYLIYVILASFVVVAVVIFFATRKKVSAKLERGHVYLLLESQSKKGLQLVKEYGRLGYEGLVITRLSPEQVRKKKLKKQKILQLSSATKEDAIPPDNVVNILLRMKEFMTSKRDSILLLDGLDYLVIQNTFEDAMSLIQKLAESVTLYKGILLVSLNPKSLEEKQLVILEGEMEHLEV